MKRKLSWAWVGFGLLCILTVGATFSQCEQRDDRTDRYGDDPTRAPRPVEPHPPRNPYNFAH